MGQIVRWTEGDTAGVVTFTFADDLTGKTVLVRLTRRSDELSFQATLVIDADPTTGSGVVPLVLLPTPEGVYDVEGVEQFGDGTARTLPTPDNTGLVAIVSAPKTVAPV